MEALYLAYGSNLHPVRMLHRIPDAQLEALVRLDGYQVRFHKRGQDGSGKCNILRTERPEDRVFGAVYSLYEDQILRLDEFEGSGYVREELEVEVRGEACSVFAYVAEERWCDDELKPYRWYQQLVYWGAHFHQFPLDYLDALEEVAVIEDRSEERREVHHELLMRMGAPLLDSF